MNAHPVRSDSRYTVTREFTGHASGKPRYVVRFCGERVDCRSTYPCRAMNAQPVKVIFRTWPAKRGGETIALFPEIPHNFDSYLCESYMQTGQHGGASVFITRDTRPATPEEIAPLRRELESLGYIVTPVLRFSPAMDRKRREAIEEFRRVKI